MTGRPLRFTARVLAAIPTKPGCWDKQRIGVFDGETQVGEYAYSYSCGCPFYAFEQEGQWYALFSGEDYTKTDLMTLPDCKVIGGTALVPGGFGFCPVEFYVPAFYRFPYEQTHEAGQKLETPKESWLRIYDDRNFSPSDEEGPLVEKLWVYERFGFRCGCVWGDDSSWKLQLLDLTHVKAGIVEEIDIGYIELAPYPLRECLELSDDGDDGVYGMRVSTLSYHNLSDPLKQLGIKVSVADKEPS
jgi:hypothetical protein